MVTVMDGAFATYLPNVERLIASVLLQDEELVPHPAPPPASHPPLLGVDTPRGPSPFSALRHRTQEGGVQRHGLTAVLLPQGDHAEHSKEADSLHASEHSGTSEGSKHSRQYRTRTVQQHKDLEHRTSTV